MINVSKKNLSSYHISLPPPINHPMKTIKKSPHTDYVGFIKKIMKLMQKGYNEIQSVEIELRILEQGSAPPSRPREYLSDSSLDVDKPETERATSSKVGGSIKIKRVRFVDEI